MINFYEFEHILHEKSKSKSVPIIRDGKVAGYRKEGSGWKHKRSLEAKSDKSKSVPIIRDGKVVGYRKEGSGWKQN